MKPIKEKCTQAAMSKITGSTLLKREIWRSPKANPSAFIRELEANDWPIPFVPFQRDARDKLLKERFSIQTNDMQDPCTELTRNIENLNEDFDRQTRWICGVEIFLYACRSHVNKYGDAEHMRSLEGNVLWQVVVVYGGDQVHTVPYFKDQCLADLKDLRSLLRDIPIKK